jgi:hypothetical protein
MSTATRVPETHELEGDDALNALRRTGWGAAGQGLVPALPHRRRLQPTTYTTQIGVDPVEPSGRGRPMLISSTSARCRNA